MVFRTAFLLCVVFLPRWCGWRRTDDGISPGFEKRVAVARASVLWRSELATRKWGWRNSTKVQRDMYVAWESPIRVVCKRPG